MDKNHPIQNETDAIYGKNAVAEYLKSGGQADTLFLMDPEDKSVSHIVAMAKAQGAVVKKAHPNKLTDLAGNERHQGVVLLGALCEYSDLEDIFQRATETGRQPFILVADGIEDPYNLGAIIRSAVCAGAHGVVIPQRRGCAVTPAVVRASAGASSHIPIARVVNLPAAIREIKTRGVFCYCADAAGSSCYYTDLTGAVAIVIGSEGSGVSHLVGELCDATISIPIHGNFDSLNASVAAGVLLYEVVRQNEERNRRNHE